jgi:hypothetical protein
MMHRAFTRQTFSRMTKLNGTQLDRSKHRLLEWRRHVHSSRELMNLTGSALIAGKKAAISNCVSDNSSPL